jgi:hypothetical protein
VGATEQAGDRAWFSNWGAWVDVSAPGSFMYSTICRNYTFTEIDEILYMYFFGWDGYTPYMYGEGTSFACPLVAGTAALVRVRYPTLGPLEVQSHLVATGDAMAYDLPMGPRVNAHRAVSAAYAAADAAAPPATLGLRGPWPMPARAGAAWSVALALPTADEVTLELFDVRGRRVAARPAEALGTGVTTLRWAPEAPAAGVYFLRARTRLGEQATARVAVMP